MSRNKLSLILFAIFLVGTISAYSTSTFGNLQVKGWINVTEYANFTTICLNGDCQTTWPSGAGSNETEMVWSVNTTFNIQNLYNLTANRMCNLTFKQNFTTATIGSLYNATTSTIVNKTFLQNFTAATIGSFYNSTALIFSQMNNNTFTLETLIGNESIARRGNCSANQYIQNISRLGVECAADQTGAGGATYTNLAWINQSNNFVGWQNISGLLNVTGDILMAGHNLTVWATNVSFNWSQAAVNYLSSNFTAVNFSTYKIQVVYNLTASRLINQTLAMNLTTRATQLLYNLTSSQMINQTLAVNLTTWASQTLLNGTALRLNNANLSSLNVSGESAFISNISINKCIRFASGGAICSG